MRRANEIDPHETREEESFGGGNPYAAKVCFDERTFDWFPAHVWAGDTCSRCGRKQPIAPRE